jgi:hypothetical protein
MGTQATANLLHWEILPKGSFNYSCFLFLSIQGFASKTINRPENSATYQPLVANRLLVLAQTPSLEAGTLRQVPACCALTPGASGCMTVTQDMCLNIYLAESHPSMARLRRKSQKQESLGILHSWLGGACIFTEGILKRLGKPVA